MPEVQKPQPLYVGTEEKVILSPESRRFRDAYRQVRPREADEVREIVGLSAVATNALLERGEWRTPAEKPLPVLPPDMLQSEDGAVRRRAWDVAYQALTRYVYDPDPKRLIHLHRFVYRYLEIAEVVLQVVTLADIELANGSTLVVSPTTNLVSANMIIIHGTGQIVCSGFTKFAATAIEGVA